MHTEWTDRLSEYLDDELTPGERRDLDAHLAGCAECRAVLGELQQVVERAHTIEPRQPDADLWPGVARRIQARAVRRLAFTMPQALAASLAIAMLSGAVVWLAVSRPGGLRATNGAPTSASTSAPPATVTQGSMPTDATADVATVSYADAQYDAAVADLEKALKEGRGRLDQSTVAIVEHNLQLIDQAIDQARQALDADPANSYLSSHLVEARRRKLDLLRRAAALTEGD